jgi:hypothetical protein
MKIETFVTEEGTKRTIVIETHLLETLDWNIIRSTVERHLGEDKK